MAVFGDGTHADRIVSTLTGKQLSFFSDVNRFARRDVTQEIMLLAGTTVRRATLHTAEQMALLDIRPGTKPTLI